jgi:phosphoethanolamine N-methyltransferase
MSEVEYDEKAIVFLETLWGEGFLSPGGKTEIDLIVERVDFAGKTVLDLGCGAGGITCYLAQSKLPDSIIGYDVERPVIDKARNRAEIEGLAKSVEFVLGAPGILPFADGSFDIIFSKDAMVHITDKESLFVDLFRILKQGGVLVASDWLTSHDGEPSQKMKHYLAAEGLSFGMASSRRYEKALADAGFCNISTNNRNLWYLEKAKEELARLSGSLRSVLIERVGSDYLNKNIQTWQAMLEVLQTGEHCPTHLFAEKPYLKGTRNEQ